MKKITYIFFLLGIFLISCASASTFGYNYLDGQTVNTGGNYTIDVNNTIHHQGYTVLALRSFFETYFNNIYCKLTGCNMTGNINMNEANITNVSVIAFGLTDCNQPELLSEGSLCWNADKNVVNMVTGLGNVVQLSQEVFLTTKNKAGVKIYNGQIVSVRGSSGEIPEITLANASSIGNQHNLGMVTVPFCNDNTECQISIYGEVHDIDTSIYSEGDEVYLSATINGNISTTPLDFPNFNIHLGTVLRSHATTGIIQFQPEIDYNDEVTLSALGVINNITVNGYINGVNISNLSNIYIPYNGANKNVNLSSNNFSISNSTGQTLLFVNTNNSRVGIGTTAPLLPLHVTGNIMCGDKIYSTSTTTGSYFDNTGFTILGGTAKFNARDSMIFTVDYLNSATTRYIDFAHNSAASPVSMMRVVENAEGTGDLGIGTITPTTKLDVNGSILANGTINATGDGKIGGNLNITGNLSVKRPYWNGYDNSTQNFLNTSAIQVINISNNNDFDSYGIHVVGNQNLTFDVSGDYLCILSPEFFQNGGGSLVTFWYQKNGVDVRWTNSRYTMTNNEYHAPNIPFQFDITNPATDNIRFMWYSDSTNTQIYSSGALTSPTRPSIPGIILNCQKVSEVT